MKTIKLYGITCYALEVLRTALEVQTGSQVRFGELDLTMIDRQDWSSEKDPDSEKKAALVKGHIYINDGKNHLTRLEEGRVELSQMSSNVWRANRIWITLLQNACISRYIAHCEYRTSSGHEKFTFPTFVRSAPNLSGVESINWRIGRSFNHIKEVPLFEWAKVGGTFEL